MDNRDFFMYEKNNDKFIKEDMPKFSSQDVGKLSGIKFFNFLKINSQ